MRKIGQVEMKVTNRSGFDKSHRSLFTMKTGTLYPILVDELLPNSTIHLKQLLSAQMPPLATDAFANVKIKTEAFFCPYRLLYGGFEHWLMETPLRTPSGSAYKVQSVCLTLDPSCISVPGSLADFLGFKLPPDYDSSVSESFNVNIYPWLCYGRIYDDWYRNSLVQSPLFVPANNGLTIPDCVATLPFKEYGNSVSPSASSAYDGTGTTAASAAKNGFYADGSYITDLRQRNFGLDYFTSGQTSAQRGIPRSVSMTVANNSTSFTIASLRAQNSLEIFSERNNFSYKIEDYNLINYGARLKRGMATRPVFLGQQVIDVYSKGIYQTSDDSGQVTYNNPFNGVASKFGSAQAVSSDTLVDSFTTDEAGIFMVICSIVPKVTYNTGTRRYLSHYVQPGSQTDLANHTLQNVGNQPIYQYELVGGKPVYNNPAVFAYTDRFAEWMTMEDEVHGLLKDGQSLDAFALQRSFMSQGGQVVLNSSFLKIPTNYLDQIFAVSSANANFAAWCEAYFDYKVIQPLAEYSIPSLQDPAYEHGKTVTVSKNGGAL